MCFVTHLCCLLCWHQVGEPRTEKMAVDQDWTSVYPAATPFRASAIPLPVRMGYPVKGGIPPEKWGNLELIKVRPHYKHNTPAQGRSQELNHKNGTSPQTTTIKRHRSTINSHVFSTCLVRFSLIPLAIGCICLNHICMVEHSPLGMFILTS